MKKDKLSKAISDLLDIQLEATALAELTRACAESSTHTDIMISNDACEGLSLMLKRIARRARRCYLRIDKANLQLKKT